MSDLNPLRLGDMPEDYTELEDGSIEIPLDLPSTEGEGDFDENLAEVLEDNVLNLLGAELCELIEKDQESRTKRDRQYEEGIRRTGLGDDAPGGAQFAGASKVVHPVMAEACVDFASSSIKELFPPSGPVKTDYVGNVTKEQAARGERKTELMNWQLTKQMPEYFDELEQLLSQLPLGGAQYLKLRFDSELGRAVSEFVPIDEILLPYAATSFYTSSRATHRQLITQQTFQSRVDSGFYKDIHAPSVNSTPEQSSAALATDKVEGVEETAYNEDGLRAVLEVYVKYALEDDPFSQGETAPYVLHIDEQSQRVLAIYRNWDEEDPGMEKLDWVVEWKFIPWRGAYGIGLPHLIGGLSGALTGALRALLDSAHINNTPSMLLLKGARGTPGQNKTVNATEIAEITAPPNVNDIRQIAMPMPFNQPSPVLFQLLGFLQESAKGVVSTAEEKIADAGNQMPVGTAMALIEQGSKVYSAIHGRLHRSQAKVLEILHRINSKWLDPEEQQRILGKVVATQEDFIGSMDVLPASDPHIFSETQRFAQMQALLQMSNDQRVQWNVPKIYERLLKLMHVAQPEELLPPVPDSVTSDSLTENAEGLKGTPLKAEDDQDHMSHIQAHLAMIMAPWILSNPMIPPQIIQGILGHVNEHILMYQNQVTSQIAAQVMQEAVMTGLQISPDQAIPIAIRNAAQPLMAQLPAIMQQVGQIQQELQKRIPPPPMPPEVQASLQIAKMDIDRKSQYDQATLQSKQAEAQAKQQLESAKLQMEQASQTFEQQMAQAQQQFDQFIASQEQQADVRAQEMSQQLDLIRNEQDNHQRQMTELLKNHEDNQTEIFIEQMKTQMESLKGELVTPNQQPSVDINPQMQQLQFMLDHLGRQQTDSALSEVVNGLKATIESINRPKTLVRGPDGRAEGIV